MSKKKKIAVVLFIIQGIALLGSIVSGAIAGIILNIPMAIGFFIPAIIGAVLFVKDKKESKK